MTPAQATLELLNAPRSPKLLSLSTDTTTSFSRPLPGYTTTERPEIALIIPDDYDATTLRFAVEQALATEQLPVKVYLQGDVLVISGLITVGRTMYTLYTSVQSAGSIAVLVSGLFAAMGCIAAVATVVADIAVTFGILWVLLKDAQIFSCLSMARLLRHFSDWGTV